MGKLAILGLLKEQNMDKQKLVTTLKSLKEKFEYLNGECVDDPEDIMNDFGIGASVYVEALEECLEMLKEKNDA